MNTDDKPLTSEDACSSIAADIRECVDFRLVRQRFKEYNVPDDVLINVLPSESGGKICFKPSIDEIRQMLQKLSKLEHGCRIFYCSLRDTQDINQKHKIIADKIQRKSCK